MDYSYDFNLLNLSESNISNFNVLLENEIMPLLQNAKSSQNITKAETLSKNGNNIVTLISNFFGSICVCINEQLEYQFHEIENSTNFSTDISIEISNMF